MDIERRWTTAAGYEAICAFVRNSHRCGYVLIPEWHPCHGVCYSEPNPALAEAWKEAQAGEIGKRGIISVLIAVGSNNEAPRADAVFNVHGSVTFSGDLPGLDGFWYGFDCAHCDDATSFSPHGIHRTEEYVVAECESLAAQLKEIAGVPAEVA